MNQFTYNRPELNRLISKLRVKYEPRYRNMKQPEGPEGRLKMIANVVNGIVKYERIELSSSIALEARPYVERLISEAIRHGDGHQETMNFANFYIAEKQYIHKLFKVLVPRFQDFQSAYTNIYKAPLAYPHSWKGRSVLELKGNPYPPMIFDGSRNKHLIHNVLLDEARKEYYKEQKSDIAKKVRSEEEQKILAFGSEKNEGKAAQDVSEGEAVLKYMTVENGTDNGSNIDENCINNSVQIT